jgi:C1A family cysteine protease
MFRIVLLTLALAAVVMAAPLTCYQGTDAEKCSSIASCNWCGTHCWPKGNSCPINTDEAAQFNKFQAEHSRHIDGGYICRMEHDLRFGIFQNTLKEHGRLAAQEEAGSTAKFGVTRWADRTKTEKQLKCGPKRSQRAQKQVQSVNEANVKSDPSHSQWDGTCYAGKRFPNMCNGPLPNSVDWTTLGAITPIKDQGKCGNCFTFGATCDFESAWFLNGNPLVSLSEQQITSCDKVGDDAGCQGGGTNLDTDKWVKQNGGIASEASYPYCSGKYDCPGHKKKQKKNGVCKEGVPAVAKFTGGYQVSGGVKKGECAWCNGELPQNETLVMEHIARAGPVTIAINSEGPIENYKSGILAPGKCPGKTINDLDHQIAIVGYGEENGQKYWKLRNSWGTDYGEKGYVRLAIGKNYCGVVRDATHVKA